MVAPEASPDALREGMARLPPHPDTRPALEALRERGDTLAALTQSVPDVLERQLANAGIRELLDLALSVDAVRRFKPAPESYRHACERHGVDPADATMVAAHAWDVAGAAAAGMATVL